MKTIMISNQKGGVGKTTTTLELLYLFGQDYKVLGIDLDPQMNLTLYCGAKGEKTAKDVLDGDALLEDAVVNVGNFDLLMGDPNLSKADKLYGDADDIFLLNDILEYADYDFVFIDSAPGRSTLLYMEYIASDYSIIPTECDEGAIEGIINTREDMKRFQKRGQSHVKILGTILTKTENTSLHQMAYQDLKDIHDKIGADPFKTVIRKSIVASETKTARMSINEYKKDNNVAKDYRMLYKEILDRIEKDNEQ